MNRRAMLCMFAFLGLAISTAGAALVPISIVDFQFEPASVTVAVGDSIRWTNNGTVPHTATSGDNCEASGDWDSGTLEPGQSFTYGVDQEDAGRTVDYFCRFHCASNNMVGSFTVQSATPDRPTSWGKVKSLYQ